VEKPCNYFLVVVYLNYNNGNGQEFAPRDENDEVYVAHAEQRY